MRPLHLILALALSVALVGCKGGPAAATAAGGDSIAATSGGGGGSRFLEPAEVAFFLAPEQADLKLTALVEQRRPDGSLRVTEEIIEANGAGDYVLRLNRMSGGIDQPLVQPSALHVLWYELWSSFFLRYRNLHVVNATILAQNYTVQLDPGAFQVAGRDVAKYRVESRAGLGWFEILVDTDTHVMLAWSRYSDDDELLMRMETRSVTYGPNHQGTVWAAQNVSTEDYQGPGSAASQLGFLPLGAGFIPESFYHLSSQILLSDPRILLNVYTDGLQSLFVAQHRSGIQVPLSNHHVADRIMRYEVDLGQTRMAMGAIAGLQVYVIGSLDAQTLGAIFDLMR